ncbi:MAG: FAD-binding oxidoreductase [Nanoarchaeota archaeon]
MSHKVKILKIMKIGFMSHNAMSFLVEKPEGYKFVPGQATDISINKPGFEQKKRAFTICGLNDDLVLEFTIKKYKDGVTEKLHELKPGDELIIEDPFGTISYKGKGVFIAGGTGVTPFVAISRQLKKENKLEGNTLIFSNKKQEDILFEKELINTFKENLILTLTEEKRKGYEHGKIDKKFLSKRIKDFNQHFYVCGPAFFVKDIKENLIKLGAKEESIIYEK